MSPPLADALGAVRQFWDTEPCGASFVAASEDDRKYFASYRKFRYRTEWHIPGFARFDLASGQRVLEIGCGNGADGAMFAMHGAAYTGVDLTPEAVAATRRHFDAEGLCGTFRVENAERLSFADASFDIVYSFGVLHHTPDPARAIREVHRVLKPGGTARIMLYHRHSFNYYARILGYMRARVLLHAAMHGGIGSSARGAGGVRGVRGNGSSEVWEVHHENLRRMGWRYLRAENFVHHCTDGPECPYAFTYSRRDAAPLFAEFGEVAMSVGHFPLGKYLADYLLPRATEAWLASRCGWHLLIQASK